MVCPYRSRSGAWGVTSRFHQPGERVGPVARQNDKASRKRASNSSAAASPPASEYALIKSSASSAKDGSSNTTPIVLSADGPHLPNSSKASRLAGNKSD